jgi:tetratricopeptide (TPR) repeat protein
MAGEYRGVLKVAGTAIRGWLMDTSRPDRRIRFNLVIDNEIRGTYAANRRRRFLIRQSGASEDTHGFLIPIRKIWITGAPQRIRLEDPSDPSLQVSLLAKLGPAAHVHFEEHVVSHQVSIGLGEPSAHRPRPERAAEDEADHRPPAVNKALFRQLRALGDAELAALLSAVDREIVLERLKAYEKAGDLNGAAALRRLILGPSAEQRLTALGRVAMKAHGYNLAARANTAAVALQPQSFEANLQAGATKSALGEFDEALRFLRAADRLETGTVRAKREMIVALTKQMRGELRAGRREELRAEHLSLLRSLSASQDAATRMAYRIPFATALYTSGRYDEAIAAANAILEQSPHDPRALMIKARSLVARNQISEARDIYQKILEFDPAHRGARMNMRVLAALAEDESTHRQGRPNTVALPHAPGHAGRTESSRPLVEYLLHTPHRWICTAKDVADHGWPPELDSLLGVGAERRIGCVEVGLGDGRRLEFWRRDALLGLAESGLLDSLGDSVALNRWKPFYAARPPRDVLSLPAQKRRGIAVLVSRNGAELYGGGEQFLENVAEHHVRQGLEPVIVGTRPELRGEERSLNGYRCAFVGDTPAEMRKFLLENDVSLVHAISGVGFLMAEALNFTNIPFVYGVHFWNELLGDPQQAAYFDEVTGAQRFRQEFRLILARATAVYANSRYTQKIIEEGFGVRCPIVYAVPRDRVRDAAQH